MRKSDLNRDQLYHLSLFNLILECHGWEDVADTELRFDQGELVAPEGNRSFANGNSILEARFHSPINMVTLRVYNNERSQFVTFHFLFDNRPERILEWIAAEGNLLDIENYRNKLKHTEGLCEMTLLEISQSEIYEVRPPAAGGSAV